MIPKYMAFDIEGKEMYKFETYEEISEEDKKLISKSIKKCDEEEYPSLSRKLMEYVQE
nr:MAG: hypothetical protein [Bacteriophage sp.]